MQYHYGMGTASIWGGSTMSRQDYYSSTEADAGAWSHIHGLSASPVGDRYDPLDDLPEEYNE